MSISMILLTVIAVLVFFGVLERVLDRMHLTDRMALLLIALMFLGTLLPNVSIGMVSVNVGGAVIPLGVCIYLSVRSRILPSASFVYSSLPLMPRVMAPVLEESTCNSLPPSE